MIRLVPGSYITTHEPVDRSFVCYLTRGETYNTIFMENK